jgi:hypothetical protein
MAGLDSDAAAFLADVLEEDTGPSHEKLNVI